MVCFVGETAFSITQTLNANFDNDNDSSIFREFHPSTRNICNNQKLKEGLLMEAKALGEKVGILNWTINCVPYSVSYVTLY